MREIKFRAWDKHQEKWVTEECSLGMNGEVQIPNLISFIRQVEDIVVVQYTGLKDKKRTEEYPEGQEIYEGDICLTRGFLVVNGKQTRPEHRFEVEQTIEAWYKALCLGSSNNIEVIGNIYENKELLNGKQT